MKHFIILVLVFICLVSCATQEKTVATTSDRTETQSDSTYVTKDLIPVEQIVTVPADSLVLSFPLMDITAIPTQRTNGRTSAAVSIKDNRLDVTCKCEEYKEAIVLYKEVITELRETIKQINSSNTSTTVIKQIPWYAQPKWWVIIAIIFGVLNLALKFFKP